MKSGSIDRRLITIILIVFVQMLGSAMIFPILPLYAQSEFNLEPQFITLLGTAFFAAQFLAGPYLGRLSDRLGRVPVLVVSQIGTVISFLMLGFAPTAGFLFFARLLDGVTGGNIIVAQAYIADITPPERKTEAFGYVSAAFGIGFILGPAIGGVLAANFGPRVPYYMAAVAAAVVVVLTMVTLEETVSEESRQSANDTKADRIGWRTLLTMRSLILILWLMFSLQLILGFIQATLSLYAEAVLLADASEAELQIGLAIMFAAIGLTQVLTQGFLIRQLLPKLGEIGMIIVATFLIAVGQFSLAQASGLLMATVSVSFLAMGLGFATPSINSLATTVGADSIKGQVLGIVQSAANLGIIVSTAIAGVLFAISPFIPYWVGFGLALFLFVPVIFLRQNLQPKTIPTEA